MNNNEQTTQDTNNTADTDTSTEQHQGTQTAQETEAPTEPTGDNSEGSQSEPEPDSPQTTPDDKHLNAIATVNENLVILQKQFDRQIARNQTQQELFDKFYQEMEANKENALFEAIQKPVINNLIQLYDHFVEVEKQLEVICKTSEIDETQNVDKDNTQNADVNDPFDSLEEWFESFGKLKPNAQKKLVSPRSNLLPILESLLKVSKDKQPHSQKDLIQFQKNLNFVRLELEEVLYRMNVTPNDKHPEELDLKLHKTVDTIPTENEEQDKHVAEIHKKGFYRTKKEKQVIRPEEVVIYRYNPSADESEKTTDDKPTNETEKTTDDKPTNETEETTGENKTSGSEEAVDGN